MQSIKSSDQIQHLETRLTNFDRNHRETRENIKDTLNLLNGHVDRLNNRQNTWFSKFVSIITDSCLEGFFTLFFSSIEQEIIDRKYWAAVIPRTEREIRVVSDELTKHTSTKETRRQELENQLILLEADSLS